MVTRDITPAQATALVTPEPVEVLLIEDDDGDALLVEELLAEAAVPVTAHRARSLAEALPLPPGVACVLLDLGLPDSHELYGVRWLHEQLPQVAVVVLTGISDEHLGAAAVRAGAQDYLVKGQVDGLLLYRVVRYAMERRRLEETQRQLREAQIIARENSRLERGLLPSPMLADPEVTVAARYRPGGGQSLLGGDFYDVVEAADGWVHALVGDVCGRGPDEAALGVCLRVAWRTLVLAGRPMDETLTAVERVLVAERQQDRMFTTAVVLSIAPDRASGRLYLAGHPPPVLITPAGPAEVAAPACLPLGIAESEHWPATEVQLGSDWSALMFTDGLIEGRIGDGAERLGTEGLLENITELLAEAAASPAGQDTSRKRRDDRLLDQLVGRVRDLNGGELDDDLAMLAVGYPGGTGTSGSEASGNGHD
jgi:serine phosphatase RsbU (regulator of sigma subunit)